MLPYTKRVRAWNNQGVPITRCVAYCKYHKYYLTENQLKKKGCLNRKCTLLVKLKHNFWDKRKEKKLWKKQHSRLNLK